MFVPVKTSNPKDVEAAVQTAFLTMFPKGDRLFIPRIFGWAADFFQGRYADYQPIDARYHNFEHTLQGTLCMAKLLANLHVNYHKPEIPQRLTELGLIAMLLHDTGYLKTSDDREGTGAKYTATHVQRSNKFAARFLADKFFLPQEIAMVQRMISCTGIDAALSTIPFANEEERIVGHALGTADLLGQMAADDYVEKLPVLYSEFAEAAAFNPDRSTYVAMFTSSGDLMAKTPVFWDKYVKVKLERDFGGLYKYLSHPYPSGPNWYMGRIELNIAKLRQHLVGDTARFLKTGNTAKFYRTQI